MRSIVGLLGVACMTVVLAACRDAVEPGVLASPAVQYHHRADHLRRCGSHGTFDLNVDHFADGSWTRTDGTITVGAGAAVITTGGGLDDGFSIPCRLNGTWSVEVEARIVTAGQNYVFPYLLFQLSDGSYIRATSLPDGIWGWGLAICRSTWPEDQVVPIGPTECTSPAWNLPGPPSVAEGEFLEVRVEARPHGVRLYGRPAGQGEFQFAHEVPHRLAGLGVRRVAVVQPWDAHVEVVRLQGH